MGSEISTGRFTENIQIDGKPVLNQTLIDPHTLWSAFTLEVLMVH